MVQTHSTDNMSIESGDFVSDDEKISSLQSVKKVGIKKKISGKQPDRKDPLKKSAHTRM
ncbi:hypothetical protein CsatA_023126 [Cannabis sativa]